MSVLPSRRLRGLSVGAFVLAGLVCAALVVLVVARLVGGQPFGPVLPALVLLAANVVALVLVGLGARRKSAELAREEREAL